MDYTVAADDIANSACLRNGHWMEVRVTNEDLDLMVFLKPKDVNSLPKRRGREASTFYPRLIEAFMASSEGAMEVDVARIGRKPETVRSALAKSIKSAGFQEKVRVSLVGKEVILLRR